MIFCFYAHGGSPYCTRKTHWEESLIFAYNYRPPHCQKRNKKLREFAFSVLGVTSFLNDQSPAAWLWYFLRERHDSPFETDFHQYGQCVHFLADPFCAQD